MIDRLRTGDNGEAIHYPINYAYSAGKWFVYDSENRNGQNVGEGMFTAGRGRKLRDCLDGLSQTLAFAEVKAWSPYIRDSAITGNMAMPNIESQICGYGGSLKTQTGHTEWVDGRVHQSGFTTTFTPNKKILCLNNQGNDYDVDFTNFREGKNAASPVPRTYAAVTARSYHTGGVTVALLDGSVRFVTDSIDRDLWQGMSTRNGREVIMIKVGEKTHAVAVGMQRLKQRWHFVITTRFCREETSGVHAVVGRNADKPLERPI